MAKTKSSKKQSRNIPPKVMIRLAAASAARCEFRGCNEYLFQHPLTLEDGNFSEHAHIYSFSDRGPRADAPGRPDEIHDFGNLMLLCKHCHDLVDDNENKYTVDVLRQMKAEHETRVRYVTGFSRKHRTHALILKSKVAGRMTEVTFDEVREAVEPMYPESERGFTIDLGNLGDDNSESFFKAAEHAITTRLEAFYARNIDGSGPGHVSVFALASIPLLVLFGRHLSDKVATRFFHRHRVTDNWQWLSPTKSIQLGTRQLQRGSDGARVGIVVSMSGPVERASLPKDIDAIAPIYEIFVDGSDPDLRLLKSDEDVRHFREVYAALLARIAVAHTDCRELHLFLATPPPVAIMCGLERLPKVQPMLVLYDNVANPDNSRTFIKRLTTR
jgi:hypothetical protein